MKKIAPFDEQFFLVMNVAGQKTELPKLYEINYSNNA
jgi:hypothetical protein